MYKIKTFDIDLGKEECVINCEDAKELGVRAQTRVKLVSKKGSTVAIINTSEKLVKRGCVGVFSNMTSDLGLKNNDKVEIEPMGKPASVSYIIKKLRGAKLTKNEMEAIVNDIVNKSLSLIDLTTFVVALDVKGLDMDEVEWLTKAMTNTGETLTFPGGVYDKHSLGGVPGDKTTLLVVPIVASCGLTIPKTSSRAITDPAGTADRMEVFAPVCHGMKDIQRIVKKTNCCIVWGGAVDLAPADDALIQVEHPLSLDPRPLLLASVMSKKHAVGSKFVVIDIPIGPEAKVKNHEEARALAHDFIELGKRLGMKVECAVTYGAQPVGSAMGPVLEAIEALETLEGNGPNSLVEKATSIAGILLEAGGVARSEQGAEKAKEILKSGKALKRFKEIVKLQGGDPNITVKDLKKRIGKHKVTIKAKRDGYVTKIHNRKMASIAKLAGAPYDKGAGILLYAKGGDDVKKGGELFTIYAEKKYKLEYAQQLANKEEAVVVEGMLLEEIPPTFIGRH